MNSSKLWLRKLSFSQSFRYLQVDPTAGSLQPFIERLPDDYYSLGHIIYKDRNEIRILTTEQGKIAIKSFGKIYLANRLIYAWVRPSKAERSFENARRLLEKGISTPAPLAYIEYFYGGLIRQNAYIYRYHPSAANMREVLRNKDYPDREKLLHDFACFSFSINQKQVYHKDYSPGNILFEKGNERYLFTLIDINRITFGKVTERKRYQMLKRLFADEKTLRIIAKAYANLMEKDEQRVTRKIIKCSNRFIQKKTRKRNLKKYFRIS